MSQCGDRRRCCLMTLYSTATLILTTQKQSALSREQIVAVLNFAARSLDAPPPASHSLASADAHSL